MSASIHSLVADYLNISDEKAQKLLTAMLREVKKRAHRSGVRLPEFGTFRERNGRLTFEPSESLARAVNRRFEGLESEDLASAPQEEETKQESEGPSTITLGYQDSSGWSPLDSDEDPQEDEGADEDSEPDTAEFQVPSADDAADTSELQARDPAASEQPADPRSENRGRGRSERRTETQDAGSSRSRSSSTGRPESDRGRADEDTASSRSREPGGAADRSASQPSSAPRDDSSTQNPQDEDDLYPLVEDAPDERSEPDPRASRDRSINEAERQSLSDIWNSETVGEMRTAQKAAESDVSEAPEDTGAGAPVEQSPDFESTPQPQQQRPEPHPETSAEEKSSGARIFVTMLVLFLLGGAAWYILGQRGMVQRPGTTLSALNTQVQSFMENPPLMGSSESQSEADSPSSSASTSSTDGQTETAADTETAPATSSSGESAGNEQPAESTPSSINPEAGGFTIVVASRANEAGARSVRDTYRQRFSGNNLPVDVIPSTVDNSTRYRIGVGQFSNRGDAEAALEKFGSELPDGAWVLGL